MKASWRLRHSAGAAAAAFAAVAATWTSAGAGGAAGDAREAAVAACRTAADVEACAEAEAEATGDVAAGVSLLQRRLGDRRGPPTDDTKVDEAAPAPTSAPRDEALKNRSAASSSSQYGPSYDGPAVTGHDHCRPFKEGGCREHSVSGQYAHEGVNDWLKTCQDSVNYCCYAACSLWIDVASKAKPTWSPVFKWDLAIARNPVGGIEAIDERTAGGYDYIWRAAADKANYAEGQVLLINPYCCRTKHQMHVFHRRLSGAGRSLQRQLEDTLRCDTSRWHDAHVHMAGCSRSQVRMYDELPGVFSELIAHAPRCNFCLGEMPRNDAGRFTLGRIGVSVYFTHKCGGTKVIVLGTTTSNRGCSIEHSIT
eukprot:TRINITY_DN30538_c0_g1_i1.p1 TRINITY_DN30538_c0_g1~~TRINITY_DN30538_c0_g1_i1.p1  ORF type:complete len:367 (+),score=69.39 TRINITY_DN30538_c0_g1_i1:31-1131(+)